MVEYRKFFFFASFYSPSSPRLYLKDHQLTYTTRMFHFQHCYSNSVNHVKIFEKWQVLTTCLSGITQIVLLQMVRKNYIFFKVFHFLCIGQKRKKHFLKCNSIKMNILFQISTEFPKKKKKHRVLQPILTQMKIVIKKIKAATIWRVTRRTTKFRRGKKTSRSTMYCSSYIQVSNS